MVSNEFGVNSPAMVFLITFVLTFLFVFSVLVFFWRKGAPVYRVERENVIQLLELVVSRQAMDNDWQVFAAQPIRHDDQLAVVQQRCLDVAETEYLGKSDQLFTPHGIDQLRHILDELKQE